MANNKNKSGLYGFFAVIIIAAIYNLVIFLVFDDKDRIFWMSYAFTMAAIIIQLANAWIVFGRGGYPKRTFLGLSVLSAGLTYLIVQLIAGFALMFLPDDGWKVSLIVQVVILAVFLIAILSALTVRENAEVFEAKVAEKRFYIQSLVIDLDGMADRADDAAVKKRLKSLSESFKYSDPMSHDSLSPLENKIAAMVAALDDAAGSSDFSAVDAAAKEIENALTERNRKAKLLK